VNVETRRRLRKAADMVFFMLHQGGTRERLKNPA